MMYDVNQFCISFRNNNISKISDLFYGMYNKMMQCINCQIITHNVQCYYYLSFSLEDVRIFKNRIYNMINILECFEYYERQEFMMGGNQIYCNNCNIMTNSMSQSKKLLYGPYELIIYLNRDKDLHYNIKILFEEYLDIQRFIYYKDNSPISYQLIGIVTLCISEQNHFIAFCKSFVDHNWYKYDNEQVNLSTFEEAKSFGVPFILFYSSLK